MRRLLPTMSVLLAACGAPSREAAVLPGASPPRGAPAPAERAGHLPDGLVADCFIARSPCAASGDLDGDGKVDTVTLVKREGKGDEPARGFVVAWGDPAREPVVLGAGAAVEVLELGDYTDGAAARAAATTSVLPADYSFLSRWDVLRAEPGPGGNGKVLRGPGGPSGRATTFDFLPDVRMDALRLDGGDSAWVLYLSTTDRWYFAPLGY